MIAIFEAYSLGLLNFKYWKSNILAGIVVGVVALPLAMAFSIASGVNPEQGIYTAIIAGFIVGIFGGTRVQISGPTGAFVVILASITAKYGINGLQIATIIAGIFLLLMGLLKIGNIIKYIPYPVIVGFTSGIAVIIFVGQWKDFFGLPISIPIDAKFCERIILSFKGFYNLNLNTTILSFLSLLVLIISPKCIKNIPSPLLAMVIITSIQYFLNFSNVATIGSVFGQIPQTLPSFKSPNFEKIHVSNLIIPAITIALLGAIESLLSAAAADSITGTKHNSNKELIGQGLANFIAPFLGGFASTGAIARTVTNIRNGGNSPIAAIVHSFLLISILLVFAPLAIYIPFSVLAAILFIVAFNMSNISEFIHIFKNAPWYDVCVLIITFLLTIFTDLVVAVAAGFVISILFFILRIHQTTGIVNEFKKNKTSKLITSEVISFLFEDYIVYTVQGPLFFGVAEKIEHAFSVTHTDPKGIIFNLKNVPFIDMTGLEIFSKVIEAYKKRKVKIFICEANEKISKKISRAGILKIGNTKLFSTIEEIFTNESS